MQQRIDLDRARKGLAIVILLGIFAIAVISLLTFNKDTISALKNVRLIYIGLAVLSVFLSWLFSAIPFYILTRAVKKPISLPKSFSIYLGGSFFGFVTPFGSGLVPAQIFILTNDGLSPGQATAVTSSRATISSWLFVVLGLVIFLAFGSKLSGTARAGLLSIAAAAAVWSLIILFFIKKPGSAKSAVARILERPVFLKLLGEVRLNNMRARLNREIEHLSSNLKDLFSGANLLAVIAVFVAEMIAWSAIFSVLPLVMLAFGLQSNFAQLLFRLFLLFSVAPASPTPGGTGLVETALAGLLNGLVVKSLLAPVIVIWRFLTYYLIILVGGLIVLRLIAKPSSAKQ
ncbi:MAG: flippase-like domain-containing protein [Firmicutes bacterium]|nr:flippase-like domain-containing protein [Bacillota bacterium]